ncbi:hypothetical protein B0H11DRAFT_1913756 [Mycena galericulata]|nr:hypothetical protein B0H11DRAFT_1913756 [Mycena galericulata]
MNGTWEFEIKLSKSFLLHFNFLLLLLPTFVAVTVTWETPTDGGGLAISAIFSILATFLLCLASAWCGLFEPGFEPCALLPAVAFAVMRMPSPQIIQFFNAVYSVVVAVRVWNECLRWAGLEKRMWRFTYHITGDSIYPTLVSGALADEMWLHEPAS